MPDTAELSPTPDTAPATPPTAPDTGTGTAPTPGSEATQTAPSEDTFYRGDPNSLPPEVREHYNNMLKDYKEKTTAIAREKESLQALKEKADLYDQFTSNDDFVSYWNNLSKKEKGELKGEVEAKTGTSITDEEFSKGFSSKEEYINLQRKIAQSANAEDKIKIAELENNLKLKNANELINDFANAEANGQKVHPDFWDLDEEKLITGYLTINPPDSDRKWNKSLDNAYNWAKSIKAKYYEMGKAEALKVIEQKATNSTLPPTNGIQSVTSGIDPKKITAEEAVALARQGKRIPQNY
jgi:hypothetical protein